MVLSFVICYLIFTPGCSVLKKPTTRTEAPVTEIEVAEADKTSQPLSTEAEEALAARNYPQALELFSIYSKKNPQDEKLLSAYVQAIETIKKEADTSKSQGNYSSAIGYYQLLADSYRQFSSFSSRLSFSSRDLEAAI